MPTLTGSTAAADASAAGGSADPAAAEHLAAVQRFLDALRMRVRWDRAAAGLLVLLAIALGLLGAFVVADHVWRGGVPAIWLPFAAPIWLALLVIVGGAARRRVRRHIDARWIAQRAEHAFAVPHNALLNAVELCDQPQYAYASDAALRHAARCVQRLDPTAAPRERTPRAARNALMVVLLAWLAFALLTPKSIWVSLGRFIGFGWPAPTATQIETIRPAVGAVLHAGELLAFEFITLGRQPRQAELTITPAADAARTDGDFAQTPGVNAQTDGDESRTTGAAAPAQARIVSLRPEPAGAGRQRWQTTLAPHEVQTDLTYAMSAGDAVARGRVRVVPQPAIAGFEIALQPPGAAAAGVTVVTDPNLLVPRDTSATIAMLANTPVVDPILVLRTAAGESRALMRIDPQDVCRASVTLTVHEAGAYRIEFYDGWKWPYRDPHMFTIRVQDAPAEYAPLSADSSTEAGAAETEPDTAIPNETPDAAAGNKGDTPGGATAEPGAGAASGAAAGEVGEGPAGVAPAPGSASGGEAAGAAGASGSNSPGAQDSSDSPSADDGDASDGRSADAGGGDNSNSAGGGEGSPSSDDAGRQRSDTDGRERNDNAGGSGNQDTDSKGNTRAGGTSNDNAGGQRSDDPVGEGKDAAAEQGGESAESGGSEASAGESKQGDRGPNSGGSNVGERDGDRGKRGSSGGDAPGGDGDAPRGEADRGAPTGEGAADAPQGAGDDDSRAGAGGGDSTPQEPNAAEQPENGAAAQPEDGAGAPPGAAGPSPLPGGGRAAGNDPVGRVLRGDPPSEQELIDAGVPPIMARLHAGALRAAGAAARRSALAGATRTAVGTDVGSRDAQRGSGLSADAGGGTGTAEDSIQRRLDRIRPPGHRVAPPGLQQVLDAYYRALAARQSRQNDMRP